MICEIAYLSTPAEIERNACDNCACKTGTIMVPPPRRLAMPCTKCNHHKLVRAIPRELSMHDDMPLNGPMFATYALVAENYKVEPVHARSGYGILEMYICRKCGFVEWYCQAPDQIPIGPEYMTEEIDSNAQGPYR
jgi:hypothetical protein